METVEYIPVPLDNPVDLLANFPVTREGISKFIQTLVKLGKESQEDPLKLALLMHNLRVIAEEVDKELSETYIAAAIERGKTFSHLTADFNVEPIYNVYDFESCNDPVWNGLMKIIIHGGEQMKDREKFLQGITSPVTIVDEEGQHQINPPLKVQRDHLKISIH